MSLMYGRCPVDFENDYAYANTIVNNRLATLAWSIRDVLLQSIFISAIKNVTLSVPAYYNESQKTT